MGFSIDASNQNTNCIKKKNLISLTKEFEQYDSYGNIIYNYKKESFISNKFLVYNVDKMEIGSINREMACNQVYYTLYDTYNQITNYIEERIDCCNCCTIKYTFYNADKDIQGIVIFKQSCCTFTLDEYDKYDTVINRAILNAKCCEQGFYLEYDQSSNLIGRIMANYNSFNKIFKIYDNNDMEINLENKTLFNNGFSKIQIILILKVLYYQKQNNN